MGGILILKIRVSIKVVLILDQFIIVFLGNFLGPKIIGLNIQVVLLLVGLHMRFHCKWR